MVVKKEDRVTLEGVLGVWFAFILVTFIMIMLNFGVFKGVWQWWMWIPIGVLFLVSLLVMALYFGRDSKKCHKCGTRMNFGIEYCKRCGTHIPSVCNSCGTPITSNSQFCENCGKQLSKSNYTQQPIASNVAPQSLKQSSNASKFCPGCGGKLKLEAQYCSSCGFAI